jgi:hypothetical protein
MTPLNNNQKPDGSFNTYESAEIESEFLPISDDSMEIQVHNEVRTVVSSFFNFTNQSPFSHLQACVGPQTQSNGNNDKDLIALLRAIDLYQRDLHPAPKTKEALSKQIHTFLKSDSSRFEERFKELFGKIKPDKSKTDRVFIKLLMLDFTDLPITDELLIYLVKKQPQINDLQLRGCHSLSDKSGASLASLKNLERIDVSGCTALTDSFVALISVLTKLKHLDLGNCENITNEIGIHIASLQNLETLNLKACGNLSDRFAEYLTKLPKLQTVDMSRCIKLTSECGLALCDSSSLLSIQLNNCPQVTDRINTYLPNRKISLMKGTQ